MTTLNDFAEWAINEEAAYWTESRYEDLSISGAMLLSAFRALGLGIRQALSDGMDSEALHGALVTEWRALAMRHTVDVSMTSVINEARYTALSEYMLWSEETEC